MSQRLEIPSNATETEIQEIHKRFDNELGVSAWWTPGGISKPGDEIDPDAPLWWTGEEDASQSFLRSMGVVLKDG